MRVVAVIQARIASTRLPGKVLKPLAGEPLLARMLERVQVATELDDVVVATTTNPEDDAIRTLCAELDVPCFRGHPTDLLDRHYRAGVEHKADAVVKIPSDCPLIDPAIIDRVIAEFRSSDADFVSNLHPQSYPDGNDVEAMPMAILETAWREAKRDYEREHTTPFVWDQPERFRIANVAWDRDLSLTHRFTIDYAEDYELLAAVYDALYGGPFALDDILQLLDARPDIFRINAHLAGINWYRHHAGELRTIGRSA
ncbi:MAG: glycosyltransferase family protein [Acidobacteria bacterium]|nr:glycosyltransferase family protein [Acidobacteriota bacterium]